MSKKANPPPPPPVRGAQVLLALGIAESALSLFQWSQLLTLRQGGATVCGVSERVNCEAVWNTPFAGAVHELLRMPVAALGLVWGLVAVALSALYLVWQRGARPVRPAVNGLRLTAAAGVAACAVFAAVSASTGVLCPTCLGTYVLTLAFAAVAWKGLPGALLPQAGEWATSLKWTVGFTAAAYVALLVPGTQTPRSSSSSESVAQVAPLPGSLEAYLKSLSAQEQQAVSDALALYRQATPLPAPSPARRLYGTTSAPVKMVEWTDSRCPHCKALVETLTVMKKRLPEGKLSLEARQYPLDSECNFTMPPQATDGSGIRCVAAKGQICIEDAPDYWELREKLFAAQRSLTSRDAVLQVLSSGSMSRMQLDACVARQDTERKLRDDIAYARQHDIHGTPLVVINGREARAFPAFLYALILADGNPDASAFGALPTPRAFQAHQAH
ncbi:vitamin K epoxide reductase family/thioredoxin domain protein [Cystobacter fuscus DSM 2262]|uniref:Vitamin K epoxide reductase family/thioredoxin domain protein n=1 Tax=Cystobacter fuscus (strain ATCC 25194 / DSM 2262 / NBRC 100088 / M29) TaxID=1242864 RepID=S9PD69_CYSF2|nr:thioredoxin domain-containing protein [Cystobacter fuscus]EPX61016.1 vitamin K epoxide reductase family/thioredoxin domain protein [Cystobacter fuscus DSM 2262]